MEVKFLCPVCGELKDPKDKIQVMIEKDCLECSSPVSICKDCLCKSKALNEVK